MKNETFLSIIIVDPVFDGVALDKLGDIHDHLCRNFEDFEILLIDRCVDAIDQKKLTNTLKTKKCFRYIKLGFKVNLDIAVYAGLENAIGDHVFIYNLNIHKVENIDLMYAEAKSNQHILIATYLANQRSLRGIANSNSVKRNLFAGSLRTNNLICLSRKAVNLITKSGRFKDRLQNKLTKLGLDVYQVPCLQASQKAPLTWDALKIALNAFLYSSPNFFRILFCLPLLTSPLTLFFLIYATDLSLAVISVLVSLILINSIFMFVIYEFTNRLLLNKNEHFEYIISNELLSESLVNTNRLNIESN